MAHDEEQEGHSGFGGANKNRRGKQKRVGLMTPSMRGFASLFISTHSGGPAVESRIASLIKACARIAIWTCRIQLALWAALAPAVPEHGIDVHENGQQPSGAQVEPKGAQVDSGRVP